MKKLLLGVGVLFLGATAIKAQETKFGVKAGYAMATLKAEFPDEEGMTINSKMKSTFYVAGLVEHKMNDQFAVQAELGYTPLGGKFKSTYTDPASGDKTELSHKINLGTIYMPLMAKYYFNEAMNVQAGVNLQYIISAKYKLGDSVGDDPWGIGSALEDMIGSEKDIKKDVKPFSATPFIGLEYVLENGMFFGARYNLGVMNIAKNNGDNTEFTTMKNSFLQVGLGFKFGGR
jgi:hypothetical protein